MSESPKRKIKKKHTETGKFIHKYATKTTTTATTITTAHQAPTHKNSTHSAKHTHAAYTNTYVPNVFKLIYITKTILIKNLTVKCNLTMAAADSKDKNVNKRK